MGTYMFDPSAPHIIILLVVVLILFGSTRLPGAALAGSSSCIFKSEAKKMHDDDPAKATQATAVQQPAAPQPLPAQPAVPDATQQQLQDIQRQLQDLQRRNAGGDAATGAPRSEPQRNQQPL